MQRIERRYGEIKRETNQPSQICDYLHSILTNKQVFTSIAKLKHSFFSQDEHRGEKE